MSATDYSITAQNIIDDALDIIGVLRAGDSAVNDPYVQATCLRALNLMLKNFQNYGIEQWLRKTKTFTLTANKASYSITETAGTEIDTDGIPERVIQAYVTPASNQDVEMLEISMSDYWQLSYKTAPGTPNQYAYDFRASTGVLYVWPVPTVGTNTMTIIYHKPYNDFDTASDVPDVPQRWYEALVWQLAVRLAPRFARPLTQEVMMIASKTLENAVDSGYEDGSLQFQPSRRGMKLK